MKESVSNMVNRIDYDDGHFDILNFPVSVDVLNFVDKYFRFHYTNVKVAKSSNEVLFFGLKDFGEEPYRVNLTVSLDDVVSGDYHVSKMYYYDLTVSEGFYNRVHETGFLSSEGRFILQKGNTYV